jgi:hypothetical protein
MRALIDAVDKALKDHPDLSGVTIQSYGSTYQIPEDVPYINVVPRSKERERQFIIGTNIQYDVFPEVEIHVWESSMESLREAFNKCEDLAEKVLDILADVERTTLNVNTHESQIESYEDGEWETTLFYMATIVLKTTKDESYS